MRGGAVRDPPGVEADGDQPPGETAPLGVEVKRIPKTRSPGPVRRVGRVSSTGLPGLLVMPTTVPVVARRDQW
ncbi:hypothetical protein [Streptomyces radiopugnans]|uniref:hypothetical protein n=1 Tax=Streptomyces radiopugnans TaxID=403935 RepID=UPI003183B1CF